MIRQVWYSEETPRANLKVVAVLIEAKRGLPPLRARHVGRAEWQPPRAVLTLAGMVQTMF